MRQVTVGHEYWTAQTPKNGRDLGFIQFAPEFAFLVLDLGADVLRQLRDDVVLLRLGQPEFDGVQVTIDEFHIQPF